MLTQVKRLLNRSKDIFFCSPFLPFWRSKLNGKAMVYLYHRIEEEGDHSFLDDGKSPITSPSEFKRDIQTLKKLGATFIRFTDLLTCSYDPGTFYVVICADDGFESNYSTGQAVCDEEGIPQTIFQCSAMIETEKLIWEHQLYYLMFNPKLSESFISFVSKNTAWPNSCDEIRKNIHPEEIQKVINDYLLQKPHIKDEFVSLALSLYPTRDQLLCADQNHEIASHGDNHFHRRVIDKEEFNKELKKSSTILSDILGENVQAFSYPFNDYKKPDSEQVKQFFSIAATVDGGAVDAQTNVFFIPRNTFPGPAKNKLRHRRWLFTGGI